AAAGQVRFAAALSWAANSIAYPKVKTTNISRSTSTAVQLRGRRFARLIAIILLLAAIVVGVWLQRAPLLREAANLWIVSDPVTPSDVVAVLGGDFEGRPFVAAELYKKGLVSKVLVSQVGET